MAWQIVFARSADKALTRLPKRDQERIRDFLRDRVAGGSSPRALGTALQGARLGELWRYRVGDYRLLCQIKDEQLVVLVVELGHRREVYR